MRELVPLPWVAGVAVLVVAGIVVLVLEDDGVTGTVGFGLLGLGLVLATGLAFYAVGRSEDIERERRGG